jgi:hypothetical protein
MNDIPKIPHKKIEMSKSNLYEEYLTDSDETHGEQTFFFYERGFEHVFAYHLNHYGKIGKTEGKNYLLPDYTVPIPRQIAEKLNWRIGTEIVVSILDEENSEAVISKKFHGEEARQKFRALREGLYDDSDE